MKKIELLAPAGDLEKLKIAVDYGADAVYFGGEAFGLRAASKNFTLDDIKEGVQYAHSKGVRAYLTVNVFAHNEDIAELEEYLIQIKDFNIDAFIVSDIGVMEVIKANIPDAELHLSTQANTTNYMAANFYHKIGISRIVLARELSFDEIKKIRENTPKTLELEAFVQGAMCISYSGRCLLSNFMAERDANRGECAQPCRWHYHLVEEKRPGEYMPIYENDKGTYIFNSKDLCMIEHIGDMVAAGIVAVKIEGRMKSIFYVATIVNAYRKAIDEYYAGKEFNHKWLHELRKVSNRNFTKGFFFGKTGSESQNYKTASYSREYNFLGLVLDYDENTKMATIEQRNKICVGDLVEIFGPEMDFFEQLVEIMEDDEKNRINEAPHAQQKIKIKMDMPVRANDMIRKQV